MKSVCDYVHLNPVRAKLLEIEQPLKAYRWSSYPEYLLVASKRPAWLRVDRLLGQWGIGEESIAGRNQFARGMEERKAQEESLQHEDWKRLRRGWCWGRRHLGRNCWR